MSDSSDPPSASKTDQPDADTIKMFVGQIPRSWSEAECKELFEKYGPVYQLNVLRDKNSQGSRGCCFVTFFHRKDAINAQAALHDIEVLPGMHHPIQMKPADSENRNERKLFVGMISKRLTEDEVKELFSQFGHIEECTVLRDTDGRSKGCAFVTLSSRMCALNAIKHMHHSTTMEGCNSPMVVKFADTTRDKDMKKPSNGSVSPAVQPQQANILGQLANAGQAAGQLQALQALAALLQPAQQGMQQQPNVLSLLGNVLTGLSRLTDPAVASSTGVCTATSTPQSTGAQSIKVEQAALFAAQAAPQQMPAVSLASLQQNAGVSAAPQLALLQQQQQQQILQMQQPSLAVDQKSMYGYAAFAGAPAQQSVSAMPPKDTSPVSSALASMQQPIYQQFAGLQGLQSLQQDAYLQALTGQQAALNSLTSAAANAGGANAVGNGQSKGPEGSNLFIYHLPQDFGDSDLITTFSPFGAILSAKVFIDKQTNLSKCFGFVSYDNAVSAANAIQAMNGFQIGSKRLKVQLKGSKGQKPYAHQMGGTAAVSS